jgi:short-subunit dehydrogenase involved in D-alanine esterification of teichoic acids
MEEVGKLKNSYDTKNRVLTGTITIGVVEQADSKEIYSLIEKSLKEYPDYNDYILNAGNVNDIKIESFGYLVKALSIVRRTAGYMVLVMKEEILQKFMLTNPEMFDYYAVFFNTNEALEYILSKR